MPAVGELVRCTNGAWMVANTAARMLPVFYEPTVLVDVDHGMDCMREETFGPTLPVMKVRDAAEAIDKANECRFGLSGSVWTRDKVKAMTLARQMSTGAVSINNVLTSVGQFPLPMAGWKESGIGSRSGGADGIRKYCRTKSIVAERIVMKKEPNWYPYNRTRGKIVSAAAQCRAHAPRPLPPTPRPGPIRG